MLNGLDFAFGPSREIVVAGTPAATDTNAMLREIRTSFLPNKIVLLRPAGEETPAINAKPRCCCGKERVKQ